MKKRMMCLVVCLLLVILTVPVTAWAAGGYVASKSSDIYHTVNCHHVKRISEENLVWFQSREQAERSGRRPCESCMPDVTGTDFYQGETGVWSSSNPIIQDQLEDEYLAGYQSGAEAAEAVAAAEKAELEKQHAAEKAELEKQHAAALEKADREKKTVGGIGAAAVAATVGIAVVGKKRRKQEPQDKGS